MLSYSAADRATCFGTHTVLYFFLGRRFFCFLFVYSSISPLHNRVFFHLSPSISPPPHLSPSHLSTGATLKAM